MVRMNVEALGYEVPKYAKKGVRPCVRSTYHVLYTWKAVGRWVGWSVGRLVGWSVGRSVGRSVGQYSETDVMYFLFSLLRIRALYMFRELLAHPQEALRIQHLVYCVHVMSDGCTRINPDAANWYNTHSIYQVPLVWRWGWATNARNT
jgi:hypothetical protein